MQSSHRNKANCFDKSRAFLSALTGLGDITQSLFFSPKAPTSGGLIWGVGPALLLPTATDDLLGTVVFSQCVFFNHQGDPHEKPVNDIVKCAPGWRVS